MTASTKSIVIGTTIAALVVVAALTILNKGWWARRINARWTVGELTAPDPDAPDGFSTATFTRVSFDAARAAKYSLGELVRLYYQGLAHWIRK